MSRPALHVAIVDDDAPVCRALARLLRASGFAVDTYASAREFLGSLAGTVPQCLVVDLRMPEMTGLDLHRQLVGVGMRIPTKTTCAPAFHVNAWEFVSLTYDSPTPPHVKTFACADSRFQRFTR